MRHWSQSEFSKINWTYLLPAYMHPVGFLLESKFPTIVAKSHYSLASLISCPYESEISYSRTSHIPPCISFWLESSVLPNSSLWVNDMHFAMSVTPSWGPFLDIFTLSKSNAPFFVFLVPRGLLTEKFSRVGLFSSYQSFGVLYEPTRWSVNIGWQMTKFCLGFWFINSLYTLLFAYSLSIFYWLNVY